VPRGGGFRERAGGERAERGEKRREAREPPHGRRASVGQRASRAPGRGPASPRGTAFRVVDPPEKNARTFLESRARGGERSRRGNAAFENFLGRGRARARPRSSSRALVGSSPFALVPLTPGRPLFS
jgi:hypothetical protein